MFSLVWVNALTLGNVEHVNEDVMKIGYGVRDPSCDSQKARHAKEGANSFRTKYSAEENHVDDEVDWTQWCVRSLFCKFASKGTILNPAYLLVFFRHSNDYCTKLYILNLHTRLNQILSDVSMRRKQFYSRRLKCLSNMYQSKLTFNEMKTENREWIEVTLLRKIYLYLILL